MEGRERGVTNLLLGFSTRTDTGSFFSTSAAAARARPAPVPGTFLVFPAAWQQLVAKIPSADRGDVVKGLAKILGVPPQNGADRDRIVKAASACVAWEGPPSRLAGGENRQGQPNHKYA